MTYRVSACQRRPGIADRLGERTLATHPVERRVEERLQLHQQRPGVLFARGATLIGWPSADAAFDGEQGGDRPKASKAIGEAVAWCTS